MLIVDFVVVSCVMVNFCDVGENMCLEVVYSVFLCYGEDGVVYCDYMVGLDGWLRLLKSLVDVVIGVWDVVKDWVCIVSL